MLNQSLSHIPHLLLKDKTGLPSRTFAVMSQLPVFSFFKLGWIIKGSRNKLETKKDFLQSLYFRHKQRRFAADDPV